MATSPNRRQRTIQFTTPKVADLVVVEVVDASKHVSSADSADNNEYGSPHPDTSRFPDFKLALIKAADEQGQFQNWYYIKDRAEQDKYNWEFQAASASMRYDSVVRTYVLPRYGSGDNGAPATGEVAGTDYFEETAPALNTAMPTTIHDPFGQGVGPNVVGEIEASTDFNYVLFEKKQVRSGDETLDSLYVVEQRVYVKKVPIRRVDLDPQFSVPLRSKETIYYKDEVLKKTTEFKEPDDSMSVLDPSVTVDQAVKKGHSQSDIWGTFREADTAGTSYFGIFREVRQLSNNWFAVAEREVIKTQKSGSPATEGLVKEYYTTQDYTWPAVLDTSNGGPVDAESWQRKENKGADTVVYPVYKRDTYRGPTKMLVQLFWSATPYGEPVSDSFTSTNLQLLVPMLPRPVQYKTPIVSLSIKPTLHPDIFLTATSGTNHPIYEYTGSTRVFTSTGDYTDWPSSIVISDSQKPFRGGYLRERLTAFPPHNT